MIAKIRWEIFKNLGHFTKFGKTHTLVNGNLKNPNPSSWKKYLQKRKTWKYTDGFLFDHLGETGLGRIIQIIVTDMPSFKTGLKKRGQM